MLTSSAGLKSQHAWQESQGKHQQKTTQREGANHKLIKNIQNQESVGKRARREEPGKK